MWYGLTRMPARPGSIGLSGTGLAAVRHDMRKVTLLALAVQPADPLGYKLTASLYGQGDRSPSSSEEYGPLTFGELCQVVDSLLSDKRPGWEYSPLFQQPPLWVGADE